MTTLLYLDITTGTKCTIYHTIIVLVCTIDKLLSTVHCTCKCKPAFALNGLFLTGQHQKDRPELWFRSCIYTSLNQYTTMIFLSM